MNISRDSKNERKSVNQRPGANILVIEDDPDIAEVMAAILIKQGYGVRTVESRDDALKILAIYLYDIIVMDLFMPGMGPEEFIKKARAHHPHSKLILVTAISAVEEQSRKLGICKFIGKPFDPEQLVEAVQSF